MLVQENNKLDTKSWRIAPHVVELKSSAIREILKYSSQPGVISFAGGLPAPELFPTEDMKWALDQILTKFGPKVMQYTVTRAVPEFGDLLVQRENEDGIKTSVDNIQVTAGGQQALELVGRAFLDPGDYILTEQPTYVGAIQAFDCHQAKYCPVEMDSEGMIIDQVKETIEKFKPKMIYAISDFQNPSGITMSMQRREKLCEIACEYNIPIIDDNPYGRIRFAGDDLPSLKQIGGDCVISLRTFSKVLAPGLRIGYMNGPSSVMHYFEKVKQGTDLHTNTLCQYLIYEFVAAGKLEPHIEKIKADYKMKRNVMVKSLRETFPDGISWTEPDGGLFLWVTLPEHMSAKALFDKAIELKVAYVHGGPFHPNGGGENTLRLNFSNATPENLAEGIKRLAGLFKANM